MLKMGEEKKNMGEERRTVPERPSKMWHEFHRHRNLLNVLLMVLSQLSQTGNKEAASTF
jgi:hypothetical protein